MQLLINQGLPRYDTVPSAELDRLWLQHFQGERKFPDLKKNFDALLRFDRTTCAADVSKIVGWVDEYGKAAARSKDYDKFPRQIQTHLFKTLGSKHPCFFPAAKAYALGALMLTEPGNYNAPRPGNLFDADPESPNYFGYRNAAVVFLGASLINQNRIALLTPQAEVSRRRLRGAFSCDPGLLMLDPSLPPLNLGTTFLHELDHLFMSAFFAPEALAEEFGGGKLATVNWMAYSLEEEIAAITHTALLQKRMSSLARKYHRFALKGSPYAFSWNSWPFDVNGDRNLFKKDGPIDRIAKQGGPDIELISFLALGLGRNFDLTEKYLGARYQWPSTMPDMRSFMDREMARIQEIVFKPYFPRDTLREERALLSADRHGIEVFPLAKWMDSNELSLPLPREYSESDPWQISGNLGLARDVSRTLLTRSALPQTSRILLFIDELRQRLKEPSLSCKLYGQAARDKKVGSYIGTDAAVTIYNDPALTEILYGPLRPEGGAGIRPEGGAGIRPEGGAGIRPDILHPCLSFQDEL